MPHFAVTLVPGPAWNHDVDRREQVDWDAHAAFMDRLVAEGVILLGGPVGDGSETLHAVQAEDEGDARARLAEDPWAPAGLLQVGSIRPWTLLLDFRTSAR